MLCSGRLFSVPPRYFIFTDYFIGTPFIFIFGILLVLLYPKSSATVFSSLILRHQFLSS